MHEVVAADAVAVAVAAGRDDREARVREFGGAGDGERAAVDGVEPVALEVAVELAGAADACTEEHRVGAQPQLRGGTLQRLQDAEVTTARTPRRLWLEAGRELVLVVLCLFTDCAECTHV